MKDYVCRPPEKDQSDSSRVSERYEGIGWDEGRLASETRSIPNLNGCQGAGSHDGFLALDRNRGGRNRSLSTLGRRASDCKQDTEKVRREVKKQPQKIGP